MPTFAKTVRNRLDDVISAMKSNGTWEVDQPDDEALENMGPFGINTMPFVAWLRWVFIPRVEDLIESDGPWPDSSSVATQAAREGDTDPEVAELVNSLSSFDKVFAKKRKS